MQSLSRLSYTELKALSRSLEKELAARADTGALRKRFEALAAGQGYRLEEILESGAVPEPARRRSPMVERKLPAKFVHPSNRKLAWSGRGTKPAWLKIWLEHGGSLDALETAAQKFAEAQRRDGSRGLVQG